MLGSKTLKISEFILKLQEDSTFLHEFNLDPDKVMIEAGISSEQDRSMLKSGDILKVRRLLAGKEMR